MPLNYNSDVRKKEQLKTNILYDYSCDYELSKNIQKNRINPKLTPK